MALYLCPWCRKCQKAKWGLACSFKLLLLHAGLVHWLEQMTLNSWALKLFLGLELIWRVKNGCHKCLEDAAWGNDACSRLCRHCGEQHLPSNRAIAQGMACSCLCAALQLFVHFFFLMDCQNSQSSLISKGNVELKELKKPQSKHNRGLPHFRLVSVPCHTLLLLSVRHLFKCVYKFSETDLAG